jgi:eukaryotic translation initiation factor 2C
LQEIAELQAMVKERLEAWSKKNRGDFPENIVFYRDGISESQFSASKKKEIEAIRDAYNELCPGTQLKLTFVVVGKRHNTRFYPSNLKEDAVNVDHKDTRRTNTNLKPGLYVEGVITDPRTEEGSQFDFYLQAHNAIKGTARSAHYHVLTDEIGFKGQELPDLTHQLSYAFAQATKGVSYVAPAYTADRLCERGRVYLRNWVPDWEYQKPTHASGHPIQNPNADDLKEYRERMALKLSRDNVWRHFKDSNAKEPGRGNPWHPDLDDSMFWM